MAGVTDPLGTYVFRTTGFNSLRTLAARLQYFRAISSGRLACLPLELRLRGKSTRQSHGTPIFYLDITVRSGMAMEVTLQTARKLEENLQAAGFDQAALDAAAPQESDNGAFEKDTEQCGGVVEEFYPKTILPEDQPEYSATRSTLAKNWNPRPGTAPRFTSSINHLTASRLRLAIRRSACK